LVFRYAGTIISPHDPSVIGNRVSNPDGAFP
jgi:hypothetical protein